MEVNSCQVTVGDSVRSMELRDNFQQLGHINRMVMQKGKIQLYKRWKEQCWKVLRYLISSGKKQYITVHILNIRLLRTNNDKTPYELLKGRHASVKHFRIFGSKCYIKRNEDKLAKFDAIIDEGIFLGYSHDKKAYRCFNLRLSRIVTSVDVMIDDEKMA